MAGPGPADSASALGSTSERASASVVEVTWPDLVRLVDRHPRLAVGKHQVDAARAGVSAAGAVPNPTLEASAGQGRARVGDGSLVEWGLALSVPLGWIAQRGSRIDAAEAEVDAAVAEGKAVRRDVLLQLRTLFWSLVYEQARAASLEALEAQTSALAQTVTRRVEAGEARPVEAIRVDIELEKVKGERDAAATDLSARQAGLALWLGLPAGKTLVAVADLGSLPVAAEPVTPLATARKPHPSVAAARARIRSLEAEVGVERMVRLPSFSVTGFTTHELDRRAYGVGLSVDLPVWNWNSGRIAQAEARLAAGRMQAAATALELDTAVLEVRAACRASVQIATRLGANVVPRSETAASTIEKTYELGEASLLEVIDARRTLLDSRRLHLSALAQAQIDCSRLGALVGEDPE